jgi:magnesium-transporting ATPase (P-type)
MFIIHARIIVVFKYRTNVIFKIFSPEDSKKLMRPPDTLRETIQTLAAAHALAQLDDGGTVGDPMEKATLEALEWKLEGYILNHFYVIYVMYVYRIYLFIFFIYIYFFY